MKGAVLKAGIQSELFKCKSRVHFYRNSLSIMNSQVNNNNLHTIKELQSDVSLALTSVTPWLELKETVTLLNAYCGFPPNVPFHVTASARALGFATTLLLTI